MTSIGIMPSINLINGPQSGCSIPLQAEHSTIGRSNNNTISLPDVFVSRKHAIIYLQSATDWVIEHISASSQTLLNDRPIHREVLKDGDIITLGESQLRFQAVDPTQPDQEAHASDIQLYEKSPQMALDSGADPVNALSPDMTGRGTAHIEQSFDRLSALCRVSHELTGLTEPEELIKKILRITLNTLGGDRCLFIDVSSPSGEPQVRHTVFKNESQAQQPIILSRTVINHIMDTGRAILSNDISNDTRFKNSASLIAQDIRSTMSAPVRDKNTLLGILHIDTAGFRTVYNQDDLELLRAICNQSAVALENARLYDDLRAAHEALQENQQQLIESEKLSALGQLASGVAHEINNPMTSILGYTELVAEMLNQPEIAPDDQAACKEYLDIIESEAHRCGAITQTLLQFGRKRPSVVQPTCINEVLVRTLEVARFHLGNSIEVITRLAPDIPEISADPHQLQQVFLNLIINARDAMDSHGALTIESTSGPQNIRVNITDTGSGMSREQLEQIFTPLYTTKAEGKGTGLGLSVSQEIIEKHHGDISVESVVGKGTTFIVGLPIKS